MRVHVDVEVLASGQSNRALPVERRVYAAIVVIELPVERELCRRRTVERRGTDDARRTRADSSRPNRRTEGAQFSN